MRDMSASPRLIVPTLSLRLFAFAAFAIWSGGCSSSDTILALTIQSGMDLRTPNITISELRATVTPSSGAAYTTMFPPRTVVVLVDGGIDAGGSEYSTIQPSFFERLTLPSDFEGDATVRVDAFQAGASDSFAAGETTVDIRKNAATAASVTLTIGGPPPPDGGAGGSNGGGGTNGAGGSSGAAGEGGEGGEGGATGGRGGRGGAGSGGLAGGSGGRGGRNNND